MKYIRLMALSMIMCLIFNSVPVKANEIDNEYEAEFSELANENNIYALFYLGDSYQVNNRPDKNAEYITEIYSGQQLVIKELSMQDDGFWYLVSFLKNGTEYSGYIHEDYIVSDNQIFNDWVENHQVTLYGVYEKTVKDSGSYIMTNFPSSYWEPLMELQSAHPNWVFVAHNTGLDWETVIDAQMYPTRNLIYITAKDEWKSKAEGDYDAATGTYIGKSGANWVQASREAVEYFMNPLNFLNEQGIFQFEQLTYNGNIHNQAGTELVLSGTWMSNNSLEDQAGMLYSAAFMQIGADVNVSPYHLAGRIRQEQGANGTSPLISGTYSGYEGYYNYFNVGASGTTESAVIKNGLKRAVSEGWNTRYKSLSGGAAVIAKNYIARGQDSVYLQKFDVDSSDGSLYSHQYMQNVQAPYTEAISVKKAYSNAGALDASFVFKIPVYNQKEYVGDINSELKNFSLNKTTDGAYYLSGEIVVVEWVDGVSTVPQSTPSMSFCSTDGTENIDVFVTAVGTNTYYFDRFIDGMTQGKEYVFTVSLTSDNNVGTNKSMNVLLSTSPSLPSSALLGSINSQRLYFKQSSTGELLVYAKPLEYVGNINSELNTIELVKGPNGNYISGEIVVVEWVDGLSTVPEYTPVMYFESTDGVERLPVFVTATGTNTYYFDRSIGTLDSSREYIFTIESGDINNVSQYRKMVVNTATFDSKEGLLWETDFQSVFYKTDSYSGELRVYAVNK